MNNASQNKRGRAGVAVVSGGAQNIGLAIARRLRDAGMRVVVGDLRPPPDDSLLFCETDVCDEAQCVALTDFAERECGGVDALVCAAGIAVESRALETSAADWERTMAVNARGVFFCAKAALSAMRRRGGGAMVFVGSIEALAANPAHAAYAASKAAVHSLARNIARDHGADGIRCNAVAPGWIQTPFNDAMLAQYPDPQAAAEAVRKLHPLGRMGTPDDVASAVAWLAGNDSDFINGQVIAVDGGRTAILPTPSF